MSSGDDDDENDDDEVDAASLCCILQGRVGWGERSRSITFRPHLQLRTRKRARCDPAPPVPLDPTAPPRLIYVD